MIAPNRPAIQFDSMIWSCSHCVLPLLTTALFITLKGEFRSAGGESKDVGFLSKNTESAAGAHAGQNPMRCSCAFRPRIANGFYRIHYFGGLNSFHGSFTFGIVSNSILASLPSFISVLRI